MPNNTGYTAPISPTEPLEVSEFDYTAKFILLQNNDDTNTLLAGFSIEETNEAHGICIRPFETLPIALSGGAGKLFVQALVAPIACVVIIG